MEQAQPIATQGQMMKFSYLGQGQLMLFLLEEPYFQRLTGDGIFYKGEADGNRIICFPVLQTGKVDRQNPVKILASQMVRPVKTEVVLRRVMRRGAKRRRR